MNTRPSLFKALQGKSSSSLNFSTSSSSSLSPKNTRECITLLQRCADGKSLPKGRQIHSHMLVNGFLGYPPTVTSLINMYSKCGRTNDAVSVFGHLSDENDRNTFCYNAMVSGLVANGRPSEALGFYTKMRELGVSPDKYTFPSAIRACCGLMEVSEVRKIHGVLFKLGLELDVYIRTSLINAYLKFEIMEDAREVFDEMPERDVVLWNSMVNGYAQIGRVDQATGVFRAMSEKGVSPSSFTVTGMLSILALNNDLNNGRAFHGLSAKMGYCLITEVSNALIDLYGKCDRPREASEIFETMPHKDEFSWNSIISVHEQRGDHETALRLFDRMLGSGVSPDSVTITAILPACSSTAALAHGRVIHAYMIRNSKGECDATICNGLMDTYAKSGHMRNAEAMFREMGRYGNKSPASWNIMIMGYGANGHPDEALRTFSRMCHERFDPDHVTFVGVLTVCSHAGLVSPGREIFSRMETEYKVVPAIEHYACFIDMLGRAGELEEAHETVRRMPIEPNHVIWRALLWACRLHGDTELAEIAAKRVIELEPGHCGSYVLMSNIYLEAGRYKEVLEVRDSMRQRNLKKLPGCSWVELKDGTHAFINADRGHTDAELIYAVLISLTARLREHGYVPQVQF